jgi:hypothetical protein
MSSRRVPKTEEETEEVVALPAFADENEADEAEAGEEEDIAEEGEDEAA